MTAARYASFGAADLERVAAEARPALVGGWVRSVRPRGPEGFALGVRKDRETSWFVVALETAVARAHLASRAPADEEGVKTPFHDQLRARLSGAKVEALEPVPGDRVLRLGFSQAAAAGAPAQAAPAAAGVPAPPAAATPAGAFAAPARLALWLALFGTHANAVLEDAASGEEILSLRRGGGRPLLTGAAPLARPPLFPEVAPDPATRPYSRAIEERFERIEAERALEERRRAVETELAKRRKKAAGARTRLLEAIEAGGRAEEAQRAGELLLASLHLVARGASAVAVPDYFAGPEAPPCRIELDPELRPAEQAERYFKKAKKYRRGAEVARERLAAVEAVLSRTGTALAALEAGAPPEEVAVLAGLRPAGRRIGGRPLAGGRGPARGGRRAAPGGRRFRSRDGLEIAVGRSNEENDRLTQSARSNDVFLHVMGFAGSHVIVRAEKGKSVPLESLLDAAALAVHYSKARDHSKAEVSYTPRKYVRKPRGAKPGLVTLDRSRTLLVGRDEGRLRRLLETSGEDED